MRYEVSSVEALYFTEYIHCCVQEMESNPAGEYDYLSLYESIELVREYIINKIPNWGYKDYRIPCSNCGEEVIDIYPNRHIDTMKIGCEEANTPIRR